MASDAESRVPAARQTALGIERSRWGTLRVTGPERRSWLNGLVTCDVANLKPGQAAWGLALTRTGKITSELRVLDTDNELWIAVSSASASSLVERLDGMLIMEDAELHDCSDEYAWFSLHGPRAVELAQRVSTNGVVASAAMEWTGLGDALLLVSRSRAQDVSAELTSLGATLGDEDAWLELRLEQGVPEYGVDFSENNNPHEASLDRRAVSWSKGCYLGQEVVCMQDMRGKVRRRLKSLVLEALAAPASGSEVALAEGEVVGQLTSAAFSSELGKVVALALVQNQVGPGTALRVGDVSGVVVEPAPLRSSLDQATGATDAS